MAFPYFSDLVEYLTGYTVFFPVPTFGFIFTSSVVIAYRVFAHEARRLESLGVFPVPPAESGALPISQQITEFAAWTMIPAMLGARVFHILEHPIEFIQDPIGLLWTRSGFSVMGGWITGTAGTVYFAWRNKLPILRMIDATAPGIILGYSLGRWACQMSGDGDWGTVANMSLKPEWLPTWFWAQTYQGNVIGVVVPPPGVYPTPVYESFLAFLIFLILWGLRRQRFAAGWLFALYMVLSGLERFWIEKIRDNPKYSAFGLHFTQAEAVSVAYILVGGVWLVTHLKKGREH